MKPRRKFFTETNIAGLKYYDAPLVYEDLKVGTHLVLEHEPTNPVDHNAVQVIYQPDHEGQGYVLGYIPKEENQIIAAFIEMGWNQVFECRISTIRSDAYHDQRIHITIYINPPVPQPEDEQKKTSRR